MAERAAIFGGFAAAGAAIFTGQQAGRGRNNNGWGMKVDKIIFSDVRGLFPGE
ncbi:hypothetical protein JK232_22680 [Nissabacter archeti]|uniref:Uncharacterized protein n=1 Tax=Nissabacter archeti TaxID=1917880 RepID=A0ABS5JNV7_9GAMM|nr:hypothetical protein [Nissabacter archeti]MBS0971683.1 hypothetical protein [Nissabacter archeti]